MTTTQIRLGGSIEFCPYCSGSDIVRKGIRKKKLETVQLFFCNDCQKVFTPQPLRNRTFPLPVIMQAVTLYNLGHSAETASKLASERSSLNVSASSVMRWVNEHQTLCAFARLRETSRQLYTPHQIIRSVKLYHQQVYEYSVHRAKLDLLADAKQSSSAHFTPVGEYLRQMLRNCPHDLFRTAQRASQAKTKAHFDLAQLSVTEKQNFATRIAHLVLPSSPSNKHRHETLQRFMLANDSVTVATEIPIYLLPEDVEHLQKGFVSLWS